MNTKTHYTHKELTRRSTAQLIAIYNRLFNDNAWDVWFNPFEHRQDMLLALCEEMVAQDIVARFATETMKIEPYKAMKIVITAEGMGILWNTGKLKTDNVQITAQQMILIRAFREDGLTYKQIVDATGIPQSNVFRVLNGSYALEINKWNVERKQKPITGKWIFNVERQPVSVVKVERQQNAFWTAIGL